MRSSRRMKRISLAAVVSASTMIGATEALRGQSPDIDPTEGIGIDQNLGDDVPGDLRFHTAKGSEVQLQSYFGRGRPLVLLLVYYECPMMCTVALNQLTTVLKDVSLQPGKDFEILTVSFDPEETPELAAINKKQYVGEYAREGAQAGWHFLTGDAENIDRLTEVVGFRYRYDEKTRQYIHPTGIIVLMPSGRIARYFFGVDYKAQDLKLALLDAADRKVGTVTDQVLLSCYRFNPETGRYTFAVMRVIQVLGTLMAVGLAGLVGWMSVRYRRQRLDEHATPPARDE